MPKVRNASDRSIVERSGLFDADWYRVRYPDVVGLDPLDHYLAHGGVEGRSPGPDFDGAWYLATYSDVANAGVNPLVHYLRHGINEGRFRGPDAGRSDAPDPRELVERSGLFDAEWYRARYPDVVGLDPLDHYLARGGVEGRSPGPDFDGAWYLATYSDIANAGLNPLVHYLRHGAGEGRSRRPDALSQRAIKLVTKSLQDFGSFDPISLSSQAVPDAHSIPVDRMSSLRGISEIWEQLFTELEAAYDILVFVPRLEQASIQGWINLDAAAEFKCTEPSKVAVIATDFTRTNTAFALPSGTKALDLPTIASWTGIGERTVLVETLIYAVNPKSVLNLNSSVCWEVYRRWGRALMQISALYAAIPLRGQDSWDELVGLAPSLRECLPFLQKLYFDDATLMTRFIEWAALPELSVCRLSVVSQGSSQTK